MNESLSNLHELASLPHSDPRRQEINRELELMSAEERTRWLNMLKETDLLYDGLPHIEVPADLQAKLLQLPHSHATAPAPLARIAPRRLRLFAACLLILLPIAAFALWNMPRNDVTPDYHYLAQPVAANVAAIAVQLQDAPAPLAIASSDPVAVRNTLDAALKSYNMPFPAMIPDPKIPLTLLGGGTCAFGPTHAAFTRWTSGSASYTLYQFDGKPLSVSQGFTKTLISPNGKYHVSIWPGYDNPCTWALVSDSPAVAEAFD